MVINMDEVSYNGGIDQRVSGIDTWHFDLDSQRRGVGNTYHYEVESDQIKAFSIAFRN
jgi:hypothetical protein